MELAQQVVEQLESQRDYSFNTDKFTYTLISEKGEKQAYVTGYISVPEIDLYNELVTPQALKSMLQQIKSQVITLDYEHEAFRDDNTILPAGKIVEAKVDDRGLWVKCMLNKHSPKFKALWGSIKDGFVNAFSIAFKPLKTVEKAIGDVTVRIIDDLKLLNVALTGCPVNEGAKMTGHSMKSVMLKAIDDTKDEKVLVSKSLLTKLVEEKTMEEEKKVEETPEVVEETETVEEKTETVEEPVEETKEEPADEAVEAEPEAPAEEAKPVEAEVEAKALAELKAEVEKLKVDRAELKSDLEDLKKNEVFKSTISEKPELKSEKVEMLDLVK